MKKDGKYRFSLQFSADSEEQVRAGELLERLGNRKSAVVVAALNDYATRKCSMVVFCYLNTRRWSHWIKPLTAAKR